MEYHCKRCTAVTCLVLAVVVSCMMTSPAGSSINGPQPMAVVAPVDSIVTFTCVVNTTELPMLVGINTDGLIGWLVNGTIFDADSDQSVTVNGPLQIGTRQLPVLQDYIASVTLQCRIIVEGSFNVVRSNNATLTAYGSPEAPSNLTSTQSSSNALILSWSAPSSPVQLHYTVTVRLTNTNSTSTTTITMFNTSSTTITISRDNITTSAGSSECDQYVWSVIAINPAGSSLPTNSTTPVSFMKAEPEVPSLNVCTSNYNNSLLLITIKIPDQNWNNITVVAVSQQNSVSLPVNITTPNHCQQTGPSNNSLTSTAVKFKMTTTPLSTTGIPTPPYSCSMGTEVGLSLGIVTAYLLGLSTASVIAIIVWLCVRKRSAAGAARDKSDVLFTAANEAYGTSSKIAPMYETVNQEVKQS